MQDCACQGIRRSARAITQLYDRALSPIDIKATQFPILVGLAAAGPNVPLGAFADALAMDRTTLTRNLKPLEERGLLRIEEGEDRRLRQLNLTPQGVELLEEALTLWRQAQDRVAGMFGDDRLAGLLGELDQLTGALRTRA